MAYEKGKKRNVRAEARRIKTAALYLRGWRQADIARELRVADGTITRDLQAIRLEWQAHRLADFEAAQARELAKVDAIEREAWEAWEASKLPAETIEKEIPPPAKKRGRGRPPKPRLEVSKQTLKGQCGNPRFLEIIDKCVERRWRLLGFDLDPKDRGAEAAPTVIEVLVKTRTEAQEFLNFQEFRQSLGSGKN